MSEQPLSFITLNNSLVFNINNQSFTVMKGTQQYADVCLALSEGRFSDIPDLVNKVEGLKKTLVNTDFEIIDGTAYCDGKPVTPYIATRLIEFYEKGLPYTPLLNFWKRLRNNPSENSVKQLYRFLEIAKCPITEDGMIVSMKGVDPVEGEPNKFTSRHDRSYVYTIGVPATMNRSDIPDDPNTACGRGLHAGAYSYATTWASVVLELLIDPADVVSVPNDCSSKKLRACKVLPVAVYTGGEHNKGIAIVADDADEVPESAVEAPVASQNSASAMLINRLAYTATPISAEAFENIVNTKVGVKALMRYRASKAPAAIRRYAEANTDKLSEAYTFTIPSKYTDVTFYVSLSTVRKDPVFTAYVPDTWDVDAMDKFTAFLNGVKVVNKAEVKNLFIKKYPSVGLVQYNREQYEVVEIKKTVDEFLAGNSEGVVESAVSIKPSKAPVGLKTLFENKGGIQKFMRVQLKDTVAFVFASGSSTFLMRLE